MANTSAVYAQIDTSLKENAESILHQLGISPSGAIQMLYSQVVLTKGFPLSLHLNYQKPLAVDMLTREELDAALQDAYQSVLAGEIYSAQEVDEQLNREFGI